MKERLKLRGPSRRTKCGREIIGRPTCPYCPSEKVVEEAPAPNTVKPPDSDEHAIEMIEKKYGGKLISIEEAQELGYDLFIKWLRSASRYGNIKRTVLLISRKDRICAKFFTGEHVYSISAKLPYEDSQGYLGCVGDCRKPRVGETWTRGSDLADGKYKEETFNHILRDIVSYEMKSLQCF